MNIIKKHRSVKPARIPLYFLLAFCCICFSCALEKIYAQGTSQPRVAIINAYDNDILWAKEVADTIKSQLLKYNSNIRIVSGNLNINKALGYGDIAVQMKSILASAGDSRPDAVVLVGDEAAIYYTGHTPGQWSNVPLVLAGICDSLPSPVPGVLSAPRFQPLKASRTLRARRFRAADDSIRTRYFNLTGVGYNFPVHENIEMMIRLVPGLNEIVWADYNYYRTLYARDLLEKELNENYKDIRLTVLPAAGSGGDDLYKILLDPKPGRAILTYSWDLIKNENSSFTPRELDSLFSRTLTTPVFSIADNNYHNNYIVGGYNYSARICGEKASDQIKKILEGTPAGNIDFESVKNGNIVLNKTALERFGLEKQAKNFFEVKYVNTPLTIFDTHFQIMLGLILLFLLLLILFIVIYIRTKKNKINRTILNEYISTYDRLNMIYGKGTLNFAIYNGSGTRQLEIINAPEETAGMIREFMPPNLFAAQFLTKEEITELKNKRSVNTELSTAALRSPLPAPRPSRRVQFIVKPIQDERNINYKFLVIVLDISATIENRIEKEQLEMLLNYASQTSDIGIAYYNIYTGEGFATDIWYENTGEQKTGNLVVPTYSTYSLEDKAEILDYKQEISKGKNKSFSKDIKLTNMPDGKEKWLRQNIFIKDMDQDGNPVIIDTTYDITAQKIREAALTKMNKKAEEINIDSDKFIDSIGHEVRTPLNSIVGFCNMLTGLSNPGEKTEIINIIKRNNVVLIELINNILTISRIDSGDLPFSKTKVELNEFFRELKIATAHMLSTEQLLTDKKIDIVVQLPPDNHTIETDEWNFRQVMINLLSNAVKFTKEGSITFGYKVQEEGIYFFVKDTGCGIAPENQEKIFGRFEKLDVFTPGTGLGLSLCRSIVNHLGGEIGVISKEGEGSTFWFILKESK